MEAVEIAKDELLITCKTRDLYYLLRDKPLLGECKEGLIIAKTLEPLRLATGNGKINPTEWDGLLFNRQVRVFPAALYKLSFDLKPTEQQIVRSLLPNTIHWEVGLNSTAPILKAGSILIHRQQSPHFDGSRPTWFFLCCRKAYILYGKIYGDYFFIGRVLRDLKLRRLPFGVSVINPAGWTGANSFTPDATKWQRQYPGYDGVIYDKPDFIYKTDQRDEIVLFPPALYEIGLDFTAAEQKQLTAEIRQAEPRFVWNERYVNPR